MRKRLLAFLVSLTVLLGVMPGIPVFAEEFIDMTFHFGTINNPDIIEPVVISVTSGTQYAEITSSPEYQAAVASLSEALNLDGLQFFNCATKRPLKDIGSWDGFKEGDSILIDDRFTENTGLYETALLPITSAEATIASPVCGASSKTKPEITVPSGEGYSVCVYEEEIMANWFDPTATGEEPYEVTFKGGETYHAWFDLEADLGYYFQIPEDGSTVTVKNGTKDSCECYERMCNVEVTVTAEHDWGEWETMKEPTTEVEGEARRECSACDAYEEKTLEKLATGTTDDSTAEVVPADPYVYAGDSNQWRYSPSSKGWEYFDEKNNSWQPGTYTGFVFKSTVDDSMTSSNFEKATVVCADNGTNDTLIITEGSTAAAGKLALASGVEAGEYKQGSVIISLYPSYLDTLKPGKYTITAYFKDGTSASTTFSIAAADAAEAAKAGTAVPATGEDISYKMICGGALVCVSVLGVALFLDKKRLAKKDAK